MRALFYSSGFFRVINISTFGDNFEFHFREADKINLHFPEVLTDCHKWLINNVSLQKIINTISLQLEWIYCQEKELFRIKKWKENIRIEKSEEKNCSNNAINSNCRQPISRNFGFFVAFGFLVMEEKSDGHKYANRSENNRL